MDDNKINEAKKIREYLGIDENVEFIKIINYDAEVVEKSIYDLTYDEVIDLNYEFRIPFDEDQVGLYLSFAKETYEKVKKFLKDVFNLDEVVDIIYYVPHVSFTVNEVEVKKANIKDLYSLWNDGVKFFLTAKEAYEYSDSKINEAIEWEKKGGNYWEV